MSNSEIMRVNPVQAHEILISNANARLIDVRSKVEFDYVGHPLGAIHVAWKEFPTWQEDGHFVTAVENALLTSGIRDKNQPLMMICRSGARSMQAAKRLAENGYAALYNVEEGFEGDKDAQQHRGSINGWRYHGLEWEQG